MRIGVPREILRGERRVALVPAAVAALTRAGHALAIERGAGVEAGYADREFELAGAQLVDSPATVYDAELVVKIKELQDTEWRHVRPDSTLIGFLLLPAHRNVVHELRARRVNAIAAETIEDSAHRLPVLSPMSRISGALSITIGGGLLMSADGRGIDLADARVVVLGAGSAGVAAADRAYALGANLSVLSRVGPRLAALAQRFGLDARTIALTPDAMVDALEGADLVIGALNNPGEPTPRVVDREHLRSMGRGAVLIDISIDGGGVAQTSRLTHHGEPTYIEEGVIHYMVPNIPAAVPRSASMAYSAAVLPYVQAIAAHGLAAAAQADDGLAAGVQLAQGQVTHRGLAEALGTDHRELAAVWGTA